LRRGFFGQGFASGFGGGDLFRPQTVLLGGLFLLLLEQGVQHGQQKGGGLAAAGLA